MGDTVPGAGDRGVGPGSGRATDPELDGGVELGGGGLGVGNGRGVAPVEAHAPDNIASAITNA
jgi:hypothetical protein